MPRTGEPFLNVEENGRRGHRTASGHVYWEVYGELGTFADWIARQKSAFFVSTYSRYTQARNARLQALLTEREILFTTALEPRLEPGSIAFLPAPKEADHKDFLTSAWVDAPLKDLLARLRGYARR